MGNKINTEAFIEKAKNVHSNKYNYSKVDIHNGAKDLIEIICPIHGSFIQRVSDHLNGCGCKKCVKRYSLNTETFIEKANLKHNNFYIYNKVNYKGSKQKVTITCPKHGDFQQQAASHLIGFGCPKCKNEKLKQSNITQTEVLDKIKKIWGDKYDYSQVEFTTYKIKIKLICPLHGEFFKTPTALIYSKQGCPMCGKALTSEKLRKTKERFVEEAQKIHNKFYKYNIKSFKNLKTPMQIICPKHGVFLQKPITHLRGAGCQKCNSSHMETTLRNYLIKNNIVFEEQKTFQGCKDKALLKFDFYLPNHNICIECQGQQHYQSIECFGGDVAFEGIKKRDNIKRQYCKINNIKLIEIPYNKSITEITKQLI